MDRPTKEVLEGVASRNESACAELIRCVDPIARAALVGWQFDSEDEREDVLQQIRCEIVDHEADYDPARGSFPGWLYGVVRNVSNSHIRDKERRPEVPFSHLAKDYDPADNNQETSEDVPASALVEAYRAVYKGLPPKKKIVVDHMLSHAAGVGTHEDLALRLGLTAAAAKQLVYRVKLDLKRSIEKRLETLGVTRSPRESKGAH